MSSPIKLQINKITKIPIEKIDLKSLSVYFEGKNVVRYRIASICKTSTKRIIRTLDLDKMELFNTETKKFESIREEVNDFSFWINYYSNLLNDFPFLDSHSYLNNFSNELKSKIPNFSNSDIENIEKNLRIYLQERFTKDIGYYGQNGRHYSKICEPKLC